MTEQLTKVPNRRRWLRFSLRSLLLVILLAAAYSAGWVSHRSWNQRNTQQAISDAVQQIGGPVEVESVDKLDVLILRGPRQDVEEMQGAIGEIEAAAKR